MYNGGVQPLDLDKCTGERQDDSVRWMATVPGLWLLHAQTAMLRTNTQHALLLSWTMHCGMVAFLMHSNLGIVQALSNTSHSLLPLPSNGMDWCGACDAIAVTDAAALGNAPQTAIPDLHHNYQLPVVTSYDGLQHLLIHPQARASALDDNLELVGRAFQGDSNSMVYCFEATGMVDTSACEVNSKELPSHSKGILNPKAASVCS